jgi:hypothetical protein
VKVRLTDSQRAGLKTLYDAEVRASAAGNPKLAWIGSREGINGTTIEALERRGLARAQCVSKPYARIVGRIMQPGIQLVRDWNAAEGDELQRRADEIAKGDRAQDVNEGRCPICGGLRPGDQALNIVNLAPAAHELVQRCKNALVSDACRART